RSPRRAASRIQAGTNRGVRRTPNNEDSAHLDPFSSGMGDGVRARPASSDSSVGRAWRYTAQDATPGHSRRHSGTEPVRFFTLRGWFAGIEKKPLKLGDYSVAGLEDVCVVERKDLPDLIHTIATGIALSCWGTDTPTEELGRRRSESLSVANCCGLGE